MTNVNPYSQAVIDLILQQKEINISKVGNIERIKTLIFDENKYYRVVSLIKEQRWDELQLLSIYATCRSKYLDIVKFTDENNKGYAVTIYDSDMSWCRLKIIDIFSLTATTNAINPVYYPSRVRL
jgi:hypothetical protein